MRRLSILFIFLLSLPFLSILACGGGDKQVSGIFAQADYSTVACVEKEKVINIRNDNSSEPQRIMGVYFEYGTNKDNYFKIKKVMVGSAEYAPTNSNLAQEIIIPAGDVMSVYTSYKPRALGSHETFLDVFLNGPQLGIKQVRLSGKADTKTPDCGQAPAGDLKTFKVDKVTIKTVAGSVNAETPLTNITESFKFTVNNGKAIMTKDDFPSISIPVPDVGNIVADLAAGDEVQGTFDGSVLSFDAVTLTTSVGLGVTGKLSTGSLNENNSAGQLSLQGAPLANGKMVLVFIAKIPGNVPTIGNGVIGAKIELTADPSNSTSGSSGGSSGSATGAGSGSGSGSGSGR